jgi:hypothetical protein
MLSSDTTAEEQILGLDMVAESRSVRFAIKVHGRTLDIVRRSDSEDESAKQ